MSPLGFLFSFPPLMELEGCSSSSLEVEVFTLIFCDIFRDKRSAEAGGGGLESQHLESRGRRITANLRPAWSTQLVQVSQVT